MKKPKIGEIVPERPGSSPMDAPRRPVAQIRKSPRNKGLFRRFWRGRGAPFVAREIMGREQMVEDLRAGRVGRCLPRMCMKS